MATRYSRNNNMDDDYIVEGEVVGERARRPEEGDDDFMNTIAGIAQELINEKKRHQKTLADAVHRSLQKRVAKAKYGNPAGSKIQVRREGLIPRKNKRDLASVEASTVNRNRAALNAQLVSEQGAYFAKGKQFVMQVLQDVYDMDEDLPEELQPIGQALTKFISEALTGTFAEGGTIRGSKDEGHTSLLLPLLLSHCSEKENGLMLPDSRTGCCLYLATLKEYAASGIKNIIELAEFLSTENDTLPDELRPLWQALTDITMRTLTASYVECLMTLSERGLQEITQAVQGGQRSIPSVGCPAQQEAAKQQSEGMTDGAKV